MLFICSKIYPTIRRDEANHEKVIAQVGLFNDDVYSHRFQMDLSLLAKSGQLLGTVSSVGIAPRTSKEMYHYCFSSRKK
ncbi:hypothetical protein [Halalkalibacter urbisdiaboli]|uniref:hypothetical protein n=1 Tax=Halalkalibacter urbisdiaboli TaxID=1960589 RepID=UPI000B437DDD|nr:hypothetical protein [Halalkalibacter urbisdiaboli]